MTPATYTLHILKRLLADPYLRTAEAAFILAAILHPGATRPQLQAAIGYTSAEHSGYILRSLCSRGYLRRLAGKPGADPAAAYHRYNATERGEQWLTDTLAPTLKPSHKPTTKHSAHA